MARSGQPIFVDTSAWLALTHKKDQAHKAASAIWPNIRAGKRTLVTTDLVLAETQMLLARRVGSEGATDFVRRLMARPERIVWNDYHSTSKAMVWLERFSDRPLSMTDAVSFAVMEIHGIRDAFTFDRDFEDAGFIVLPGPED